MKDYVAITSSETLTSPERLLPSRFVAKIEIPIMQIEEIPIMEICPEVDPNAINKNW